MLLEGIKHKPVDRKERQDLQAAPSWWEGFDQKPKGVNPGFKWQSPFSSRTCTTVSSETWRNTVALGCWPVRDRNWLGGQEMTPGHSCKDLSDFQYVPRRVITGAGSSTAAPRTSLLRAAWWHPHLPPPASVSARSSEVSAPQHYSASVYHTASLRPEDSELQTSHVLSILHTDNITLTYVEGRELHLPTAACRSLQGPILRIPVQGSDAYLHLPYQGPHGQWDQGDMVWTLALHLLGLEHGTNYFPSLNLFLLVKWRLHGLGMRNDEHMRRDHDTRWAARYKQSTSPSLWHTEAT